jgi:hypothetical protein
MELDISLWRDGAENEAKGEGKGEGKAEEAGWVVMSRDE